MNPSSDPVPLISVTLDMWQHLWKPILMIGFQM